MSSTLVRNASELGIPDAAGPGFTRHPGWAFWAKDGRIQWVGPETEAPPEAQKAAVYDAGGRAVMPALVDAHTHLIFGGDRIADFSRRLEGKSYAEIAAEGGGIQTTVKATRAASDAELLDRARIALARRRAVGIGTTEVKSGYGLDEATELRTLSLVAELRREGHDLVPTLLAAHSVPKDRPREDWIQAIIEGLIPAAAEKSLAQFCDVFVEKGAYTVEEARRIFQAAKHHGLIPKLHADQLTPGGGAELAAEVGAASADHLEHVSEAGLKRLASGKVVAVLLPGALTYLGDRAPWLGRELIEAGVQVAVATDANPGSSPTHNLPLMATLAATQMGLKVEEALRAVTLGAAHALRRSDVGSLVVGARARFIVLDARDCRALVASFGEPVVKETVFLD
ncbi:MAG: imidazolonepropionase [Deltaproteobacteria bacterium]|nr:imidazolonepropionase [Deltaproteobacteria bacterium]